MYGVQRTSSGPIDRTVMQKLGYLLRATIAPGVLAGIFVVPAAMVFQVQRRCDRPRNRLRDRLCPTCAYPLTDSKLCPECGREALPPRLSEWQVAWRTLLCTCLLVIIGTAIGSTVVEVMVGLDERAFKAEAKARGAPYARLRHGPFYGEMSYGQEGLFWVVDD
jgi:hypothetical protein